MREKILVLNSGGFDSVVLMNYLVYEVNAKVVSLRYEFGQRGNLSEKKAAIRTAKKLGVDHYEEKLPTMTIAKGEKEYVPFRNGILILHALRKAEELGIKTVAAALLEPLETGDHPDTSEEFKATIQSLAKIFGMEVIFPFGEIDKMGLSTLARKYPIEREDFFSCNFASGDKGCGVCADCSFTEFIMDLKKLDSLDKLWTLERYEEFFEMLEDKPVEELRVHYPEFRKFAEEMKYLKTWIVVLGVKRVRLVGDKFMLDPDLISQVEEICEMGVEVDFEIDNIEVVFQEGNYLALITPYTEGSTIYVNKSEIKIGRRESRRLNILKRMGFKIKYILEKKADQYIDTLELGRFSEDITINISGSHSVESLENVILHLIENEETLGILDRVIELDIPLSLERNIEKTEGELRDIIYLAKTSLNMWLKKYLKLKLNMFPRVIVDYVEINSQGDVLGLPSTNISKNWRVEDIISQIEEGRQIIIDNLRQEVRNKSF